MPEFKVTEIVSQRTWEKEGRKVIYYDVKVEGQDKLVNLGRKPENTLSVGDVLEGDVEDDGRGKLKFKKANNFQGRGNGMSEEDKRGIRRQHSQEMALLYLRLTGEEVPPTTQRGAIATFFNEDFRKLVDAFEKDIKRSVDG